MHFTKLNIKIWAYKFAVNCAEDWFIDKSCCGSIEQVMQEPFRIAAVPVMFNRDNDFAYQLGNESIDLSVFDLVLLSDIEYRPRSWIEDWARENNIKNWVLATCGLEITLPVTPDRIVYRPWWVYQRDLKFNTYQEIQEFDRPFVFDALLGSRRPNRDFVMLAMQHHNLLNKNIVTYRDVFCGNSINHDNQRVADHFCDVKIHWPYVSENLDPDWEVAEQLNNSVSQIVPWEIYRRTWITIAVESVSSGSIFFMAEKISKPMMARRPFVVFGIKGYLATLRDLGYQTFEPCIDESYDLIDNDIERWTAAFEQVLKLQQCDHAQLAQDLEARCVHNYKWLQDAELRACHVMDQLLKQHIDPEYWL
jgi:hypothetical protein